MHVGGVRRAEAVLLHLRALLDALGPGRNHEPGMSASAQLAVDARDHDVDARDPTVRGPGLLAVQYPLVLGLVVAGAGPDGRDVRAGIRLRRAEGGNLRLV